MGSSSSPGTRAVVTPKPFSTDASVPRTSRAMCVTTAAFDCQRKTAVPPDALSIAVPHAEPAAATLNVVIATSPMPGRRSACWSPRSLELDSTSPAGLSARTLSLEGAGERGLKEIAAGEEVEHHGGDHVQHRSGREEAPVNLVVTRERLEQADGDGVL